ncbi:MULTISPECIES: 2Fe-2S iron-sulfur cluster-binding protein [Nocardia]|jgi:ferredoxin, 2Fe-2S|uniref:2Fe-2S iron-sulfur cluster-binding protein n=1 Tax=Nocardia abscessus TaxID=120957 RepID=UPI001892FC2C|nr:2Fe-2S iron-sulfur cluster-binding protein [Nocardia abscessus]MBF6472507.1 2Fe-2S iron-sulfur cluster binding domain-containing protein [Nocardia abscessus]
MVTITFRWTDGSERTVEAEPGETLMEAAKRHDIDVIVAECGGSCACATCHVKFAPENYARVGDPSEIEASMLDFAEEKSDTSRLSCQIQIEQELDGLVVQLPSRQQ